MNCPKCNGKTKVHESRMRVMTNVKIRRHICKDCDNRFTTAEIVVNDFIDSESNKRSYNIYNSLKKLLSTIDKE
jgi:transcriptional regulator NrdR family protein